MTSVSAAKSRSFVPMVVTSIESRAPCMVVKVAVESCPAATSTLSSESRAAEALPPWFTRGCRASVVPRHSADAVGDEVHDEIHVAGDGALVRDAELRCGDAIGLQRGVRRDVAGLKEEEDIGRLQRTLGELARGARQVADVGPLSRGRSARRKIQLKGARPLNESHHRFPELAGLRVRQQHIGRGFGIGQNRRDHRFHVALRGLEHRGDAGDVIGGRIAGHEALNELPRDERRHVRDAPSRG